MQDSYEQKLHGKHRYMYMQSGSSYFVLEFSASFQQINNETKCLPFQVQNAVANLRDSN